MTRRIAVMAAAGIVAVVVTLTGCPKTDQPDIGTITPIETLDDGAAMETTDLQPAPDFKLVKAGGGEATLADYEGKILVIDFWATSCGGCIKDLPNYQKLYDSWDHDKVEYLGMSMDTRIVIIEKFVEREGLSLPMALLDDATKTAYLGDGMASIPQARVIDADGMMRAVLEPADASAEHVGEVVSELLAEVQGSD